MRQSRESGVFHFWKSPEARRRAAPSPVAKAQSVIGMKIVLYIFIVKIVQNREVSVEVNRYFFKKQVDAHEPRGATRQRLDSYKA